MSECASLTYWDLLTFSAPWSHRDLLFEGMAQDEDEDNDEEEGATWSHESLRLEGPQPPLPLRNLVLALASAQEEG